MNRLLLLFLFFAGGNALLAQQDTLVIPTREDSLRYLTNPGGGASSFDGNGPPPQGQRGQRGQAQRATAPISSRDDAALPEGGVEYGSVDSSKTDIAQQVIHLYGQAYVRYEGFEVTSDYILFDLKNNEVQALSREGQIAKPTFQNGDQVVKADRIRYNITTEKGIVHGARIQQDQFYVHGATTKFVRAGQDSLHIDDVVYNRNAVLTTCEHDQPHWGIRTTKLKMIPDKLAVIGPFDMEIAGIPTPLAMPFAFAPLFSIAQSTSGLIFPTQVLDQSRNLGLGIRGLGYYLAISDKLDLRLNADVYFRGSFNLTARSNYRKRYKYNGSFELSYSRRYRIFKIKKMPARESHTVSLYDIIKILKHTHIEPLVEI